jgi:hypothetical protein
LLLAPYLTLAETVKNWFYKRYPYRLEQTLIPKRRRDYLNRTAVLVQDMIAVISLRPESEITIDSLTEDLELTLTYPIKIDQVTMNLQNLKVQS